MACDISYDRMGQQKMEYGKVAEKNMEMDKMKSKIQQSAL